MLYAFTVGSSAYVVANVKSSTDGSMNIPYAYTSGTTHFVANSIGTRNTIKVSDVSASLATSGAAITISAWDVNGNAIPESTTAAALKLYSRGTASITGTELAARFPGGAPMSYAFTVGSTKYLVTNVKSSADGSVDIPAVYTSGTAPYASNDITSRSTVKISDASGALSSSGAAITVAAWEAGGTAIPEAETAIPLTLYNHGTTTITVTELAARFPDGTPALFEFTIGSSQYVVTNVTNNMDGALPIPRVYVSGIAGGI
jgi:WD40 repeat protein